jgi:hypothetical protein
MYSLLQVEIFMYLLTGVVLELAARKMARLCKFPPAGPFVSVFNAIFWLPLIIHQSLEMLFLIKPKKKE